MQKEFVNVTDDYVGFKYKVYTITLSWLQYVHELRTKLYIIWTYCIQPHPTQSPT